MVLDRTPTRDRTLPLGRDVALAHRRGYPVLRFLSAFPIAFFTGALLTDLAYWQTAQAFWKDFSDWQLFAGEVLGVIAGVVGLITLITSRWTRAHRPMWPLVTLAISVLVTAFFNNLIHSRDAWISVVPLGIILSAVTVVLIGLALFFAAELRSPVLLPGAVAE